MPRLLQEVLERRSLDVQPPVALCKLCSKAVKHARGEATFSGGIGWCTEDRAKLPYACSESTLFAQQACSDLPSQAMTPDSCDVALCSPKRPSHLPANLTSFDSCTTTGAHAGCTKSCSGQSACSRPSCTAGSRDRCQP
eukprot:365910-Chlamydomonas_euryale.AAC.11